MIYFHCVRSLRFHPPLFLDYISFTRNIISIILTASALELESHHPENDQSQADESPLKTWIKRHLVSLNHDESTVGERSDFQTV